MGPRPISSPRSNLAPSLTTLSPPSAFIPSSTSAPPSVGPGEALDRVDPETQTRRRKQLGRRLPRPSALGWAWNPRLLKDPPPLKVLQRPIVADLHPLSNHPPDPRCGPLTRQPTPARARNSRSDSRSDSRSVVAARPKRKDPPGNDLSSQEARWHGKRWRQGSCRSIASWNPLRTIKRRGERSQSLRGVWRLPSLCDMMLRKWLMMATTTPETAKTPPMMAQQRVTKWKKEG